MAVTYTPGNIGLGNADTISVVRWRIDDTDVDNAEILDEEIAALYAETSADDAQAVRVLQTALACAQALERRYRKQATFSSGGTSVQHTQRAEAWAVVVADLRAQGYAAANTGVIFAAREAACRNTPEPLNG